MVEVELSFLLVQGSTDAAYGKLVSEGITDRVNCLTEYEGFTHMVYKDVKCGPLT